jgi:hypothetical protein
MTLFQQLLFFIFAVFVVFVDEAKSVKKSLSKQMEPEVEKKEKEMKMAHRR